MTQDFEHRNLVGKRLQEIRGQRDQRTFAEAVESVQQTISKYERGEIPRSWMFLARLREQEGVDLNDLLSVDGAQDGDPFNPDARGDERPAQVHVVDGGEPHPPAVAPGERVLAVSF